MALKARKRHFVPRSSGIGTGFALRLIFATCRVVKGIVGELRCLLYPAITMEQTTRGMKSLEFNHLRLADTARPFCHRVRRGAVVIPVL